MNVEEFRSVRVDHAYNQFGDKLRNMTDDELRDLAREDNNPVRWEVFVLLAREAGDTELADRMSVIQSWYPELID